MTTERISPEGVMDPPDESSYTQVVRTTGDVQVDVAGTTSKNERGELMYAGDLEGQTRHVLSTIETCLEAAGASMADVTRRRIFVRDIDDFIENGAIDVLGEFWPDGAECTSTLIEVTGLADQHHAGPAPDVDHADPDDHRFLVEIDVSAVVDD